MWATQKKKREKYGSTQVDCSRKFPVNMQILGEQMKFKHSA